MRVSVAPFFVPQTDVAIHSGWVQGDPPSPMPRLIEAWDYQAELGLRGSLAVDASALRDQSQLGLATRLQVLVIARSSTTKIERCVLSLDLPDLDHYELPLDLQLRGDWLGGRLTVETAIVALDPVPLSAGSATESGAILWSVKHDTILEGYGGLFPTDTEDFRRTRPQFRNAPWALSVDQNDFDSLFAAAVRLTLNSGLPSIERMLAHPSREESSRLSSMLEFDVTRQLAFIAIGSDDVLARQVEPEAVTLGDVLRLLVARIWPTASTASLRAWMHENPERLELAIQQFVGAFR